MNVNGVLHDPHNNSTGSVAGFVVTATRRAAFRDDVPAMLDEY
jgi:hypothetical protein